MITVKSDNLWSDLEELSKKSLRKIAAVAYVSDDAVISFGKDDILVVDASDLSIANGRTNAKVLERAFNVGAKLFSCSSLHCKAIVFDHCVYIGSANISQNSKEYLNEIGIISDHPDAMSGALQLIEGLKKHSTEIDQSFINSILCIKVKCDSSLRQKKHDIKIENAQSWVVSIINDASYPGDESIVENDNSAIKTNINETPTWFFIKKEKNGNYFYDNAKIGDSVIVLERKNKNDSEPNRAYRHVSIKAITDDKNANVKAYHYAFTNEFEMSWGKFKALSEKVGLRDLKSGKNTLRQISVEQSNALFDCSTK